MKRLPTLPATAVTAALASLLLALGAQAATPIDVQFRNPEQFSELREHPTARDNRAPHWLDSLKQHLETRAAQNLATGQQLQVTITDIRRAGDYEPWRGPGLQDVRVVRDIYPPRIDLDFTLTAADGQVLKSGQRRLRNAAFLSSRYTPQRDDPLRYEKDLIDQWLLREFKPD